MKNLHTGNLEIYNNIIHDIEYVVKEYPDLCWHGFEEPHIWCNKSMYGLYHADNQERLINSRKAFKICCEWFLRKNKQRTINYKASSYSIKHLIEDETGVYIPNGVAIASAICCGFEIKPEGINARFNISLPRKVP